MKKTTLSLAKLLLVLLMVCTGFEHLYAADLNLTDRISPCQTTGEWKSVSLENGISVSYSSIQCNGETFLAVKFENTTNEKLNFVWSLTQNGQAVIITEDEMLEAPVQLDANGIHVFKGTYLVSMNDQEDYSSFDVSIQTSKK